MQAPAERLSTHFTLAELTFTQVRGVSNAPGARERQNLDTLALTVLEPIRKLIGCPMIITSGYRSPEVNARIGGSPTSAHMKGLAADWIPSSIGLLAAMELIIDSDLRYDQLIFEYGRWLHIGLRPDPTQRRQNLMIFKPGAYLPFNPKKIPT